LANCEGSPETSDISKLIYDYLVPEFFGPVSLYRAEDLLSWPFFDTWSSQIHGKIMAKVCHNFQLGTNVLYHSNQHLLTLLSILIQKRACFLQFASEVVYYGVSQ
jgi:hypothetical protein